MRRARRSGSALCLAAGLATLLCGIAASRPAAAQSITSVSKTADLSFGSLIAGTGGTVTLNASASPTRSATGGVVPISLSQFPSTVSAAAFTVTATSGNSYSISLPSSAVTLSSGGNTMTLTGFTSSPSGSIFVGTGTATLYVGGTLNVSANQPAGTYSGSFSVTINYP